MFSVVNKPLFCEINNITNYTLCSVYNNYYIHKIILLIISRLRLITNKPVLYKDYKIYFICNNTIKNNDINTYEDLKKLMLYDDWNAFIFKKNEFFDDIGNNYVFCQNLDEFCFYIRFKKNINFITFILNYINYMLYKNVFSCLEMDYKENFEILNIKDLNIEYLPYVFYDNDYIYILSDQLSLINI